MGDFTKKAASQSKIVASRVSEHASQAARDGYAFVTSPQAKEVYKKTGRGIGRGIKGGAHALKKHLDKKRRQHKGRNPMEDFFK